jgi:hypothetical protein
MQQREDRHMTHTHKNHTSKSPATLPLILTDQWSSTKNI